jgi:hypothetical protein
MKRSVILLFFAVAVLLSSCNYLKKHKLFSRDVDSVLDMTLEEPLTPIIDTTPIVYTEPEPVMTEPAETRYGYGSNRYYMIVGCFQNKSYADRYAEKIRQMGYDTKILDLSNGFYRVSAKSYSNFRTGVSEIDDFRSTVASRAWLHVKR